jgi:protein phosphatase
MGTTLTMGYIVWPQLYVVHAGDSRCYLYRDGCLDQVTTDHTFAQEFVEKGILSPDAADRSPFSHYLWNVIGGGEDTLAPQIYKRELLAGDKILFCTDGLTRCVSDEAICEVLQGRAAAQNSCENLLDRALRAGGPDDITALVASVPKSSPANSTGDV